MAKEIRLCLSGGNHYDSVVTVDVNKHTAISQGSPSPLFLSFLVTLCSSLNHVAALIYDILAKVLGTAFSFLPRQDDQPYNAIYANWSEQQGEFGPVKIVVVLLLFDLFFLDVLYWGGQQPKPILPRYRALQGRNKEPLRHPLHAEVTHHEELQRHLPLGRHSHNSVSSKVLLGEIETQNRGGSPKDEERREWEEKCQGLSGHALNCSPIFMSNQVTRTHGSCSGNGPRHWTKPGPPPPLTTPPLCQSLRYLPGNPLIKTKSPPHATLRPTRL